MDKIVIIGNGISGVTSARHIRKNSDKEILIISAETEYFFSRTALMYVYMGHMRYQDIKPYEDWFWKKNRIDLMFDFVEHIDTQGKELKMRGGVNVIYDQLILAVGSKPNKFGWPGQNSKGVQGFYSYQDLQLIEENSKNAKRAVIVGGGLIGVELAEMMSSRGIEVIFLVREDYFWGNVLPKEEGELISRHIKEHDVDLRFNTELAEIVDDGSGRVKGIKTTNGELIDCQIVGLATGVSPNVEFIKSASISVDRGVLVNEYFETNADGVYAIGDCAEFKNPVGERKTVEQVWYSGRIMGETLAQTICGKKTAYTPGPWFNSAKFFDIEYQTYGTVNSTLLQDEQDFYWEHVNGKMAVHLVWNQTNNIFKGINTFGIRMRHDVFDKWLKNGVTVDEVMSELRTANFDPEFYRTYEVDIVTKFNVASGHEVELKQKKWWKNLMAK